MTGFLHDPLWLQAADILDGNLIIALSLGSVEISVGIIALKSQMCDTLYSCLMYQTLFFEKKNQCLMGSDNDREKRAIYISRHLTDTFIQSDLKISIAFIFAAHNANFHVEARTSQTKQSFLKNCDFKN